MNDKNYCDDNSYDEDYHDKNGTYYHDDNSDSPSDSPTTHLLL